MFIENHIKVELYLNSELSPYLFNGKERDAETGLYYYGARYYDPKISQWLSVDPLAEQTMDPYTYCSNSPVMLIDPTGMEGEDPPNSTEKDDIGSRENGGEEPKKKTATDAGHGIKGTNNSAIDPGAVDGENYEKDYALMIEQEVNCYLESWNIDNKRTRNKDIKVDDNSLNYRWKVANKHGAEVFVSFHLNSGKSDEVFAVYQQGKSNEEGSKELGKLIMSNLSSTMHVGSNSLRQVKGYTRYNSLAILNNFSGKAGILIELGGIANESNRNNIRHNSGKIGYNIALAIYQFINDGASPPTN